MTVEEKLEELRLMVLLLIERQTVKEFYEIEEFARLAGRQAGTVREWARTGRIRAEKQLSGRGGYKRWVVSNGERLRWQQEGLLPCRLPASVDEE